MRDSKFAVMLCLVCTFTLIVGGWFVFAEAGVTSGLSSKPGCSAKAQKDTIQLGKLIFFDQTLSVPAGQSCASCHDPGAGFAHPAHDFPVSQGAIRSRFGSRNAPSVSYAAFSPALHFDPTIRPGVMEGMYVGGQFWDGRVDSLEEQAKQPFLNPLEMHNVSKEQVVRNLLKGDYSLIFLRVCGIKALKNSDTAYECVAHSLAEYMRTDEVSPFDSKFDYYLAGKVELAPAEARGYALFTGSAKCSNCHSVDTSIAGKPLFTNFGHQNTGVPRNLELPFYDMPASLNPDGASYVDLGLGAFLRQSGIAETSAAKEDGKFKIPALRNVARTAPYMHNGVFQTLYDVISFNNTRDTGVWPPSEVPRNVHRHMPPMMGTFGQLALTEENINDLVMFLRTLTDGYLPPETL